MGTQDRKPDITYAVWARSIEQYHEGEKLVSVPSNLFVAGITLLERSLLELYYFLEINPGRHLDLVLPTRCTGSRFADGTIPETQFRLSNWEFNISSRLPEDRFSWLFTREVITS